MAKISGGSNEKVFRIQSFLGLNESPDGDTKLKLGEASAMRNFKITRDGSLQKRPGLESIGYVYRYYVLESDSGQTIAAETAEPYLDVLEGISVDKETGEIIASEGTITLEPDTFEYSISTFATSEDLFDYAQIYVSGSDYFQISGCYYDSASGKYRWFGTRIFAKEIVYPVNSLWRGYVGGEERILGVTGERLIEVHNGRFFAFRHIGDIVRASEDDISMFGFADKFYVIVSRTAYSDDVKEVYINYYVWDGVSDWIETVEPYVPIVSVAVSPADSGGNSGGYSLERVNLLSNQRRVWLSPQAVGDHPGYSYFLPELPGSILYVKSLITGEYISDSNYTFGTVISYPDADVSRTPNKTGYVGFYSTDEMASFMKEHYGTNTIEVCYAPKETYQYGLKSMFFSGGKIHAEQFNGTTDTRVFLCASTSNQVYYSGIDNDGQPRADYFPDLNVIRVGDTSDNVTGMIRHYSRLIVYKTRSTYSVQYGTISLADGTTTAAFYCTPINKRIGNEAFGQVQLVLNNPRTLCGKDLYEWKNNYSYSSNLTVDERQARRISDRIHATLASFDFSQCYCYDDNDNQEYYICYNKQALVHNYAVDAWYYYDNFDITCMVNFRGDLYAGDSLGRFNLVSRANRTDNGQEITGYWASGAEPFEREFMRKYSAMLWVALKPELRSKVQVTVETDRKSDHAKKTAASSLFTFSDADFRQWSFNTNRKPHITRLKIKAKKFAYYKLILSFGGENTTATVVAADMRVRYTGYAK